MMIHFVVFNPIPPGLFYAIYYDGDKKYLCPEGIGLRKNS